MKKFLAILSILLLGQICFAQEEINYNEILNSTQMPTDSEIWQVVEKFNLTPEEKQQLYFETKRQIEELYTNKNTEALQQRVLEGKQILNNAGLTISDFVTPQ
ncbi:MAG: hypothetical protein IKL52_00405 [Candidatus Gastranaerophilales bacterium]|nr:hypothetical protein [Candidatus Gastranaerophilales bacterium]